MAWFSTHSSEACPPRARASPSAPRAPANLIQTHREALVSALEHPVQAMVVDAVAAVFEQIFSDPRLNAGTTQLLSQLQLPVLRSAVANPAFFASREHPARRFMNRLAVLAASFDTLDHGPGRVFQDRVAACVDEVAEHGLDQPELFEQRLADMEALARAPSSPAEAEKQAEVTTVLARKEVELRAQLQYMRQVRGVLVAVPMPEVVRGFVVEIWSQALMFCAQRDGSEAPRTARFLEAACEMVLSVQPRSTPQQRKELLMKLPGVLKTLREGLQDIGWPHDAQNAFFKQLGNAQSAALQHPPLQPEAQAALAEGLAALRALPFPAAAAAVAVAADGASTASAPLPAEPIDPGLTSHFLPVEAAAVGLVAEGLHLAPPESPPDDDLSDPGIEPPEPLSGRALYDTMNAGQAYRMQLEGGWQKVRLTFASEGRAFYVFKYGDPEQTITLTARMLIRLCELRRVRSMDRSELIDRAALRARSQLRAIRPRSTR